VYDYRSFKFVTKEKFEELVEELRHDIEEEYFAGVSWTWRGLDKEDYEETTDRYMKLIDGRGWEWEWPEPEFSLVEPTKGQCRCCEE
jgi:hypothetical protein